MYFTVIVLTYIVQGFQAKFSGPGSTPHLKEIVVGRCWYYSLYKLPNATGLSKDCSEIWQAFYKGFAYKDPCNLTADDYTPYFDAVGEEEILDTGLFWSGTYKPVHLYSDFNNRFTTLEDTMAGWIMNELWWCGKQFLSPNSTDGIDYSSCSSCEAMRLFWAQASKKFAERVRGEVRVMVNGSRVTDEGIAAPAYNKSSFFAMYELPNFNVSAITSLQVLVIHTIGKNELEKCGSGSIQQLEQDAKARGLKVKCKDDPRAVKHILCTDQPRSRECLFFLSNQQNAIIEDCGFWKPYGISITLLASILLLTTVVMTMCLWKSLLRRKEDDNVMMIN